MRAVLAQAEQVAPTDATIMVQGETGTGKELVVHAIHAASRRKDRTLVKIACAALPEQLLESELFGHERGAFTGAVGRKAGRFEVADGGTIFFDDVDTLPLGVQAKLLRALQEGEVQRLGSNEVRRVDVRVIAATNRDLLADVRDGRFREDLYYRLNVVPLRIPPLRERREDIALLVEHFIQQDGQRLGRSTVRAVSAETLESLRSYAWPGNVRELRNVIQRALVLSRGEVLRLPAPLEAVAPSTSAMALAAAASLAEQVRDLKVRLIRCALADSGGNQRLAAERLGMHRQSLTRMIRDLGLQNRSERGS
jgi:transcriptional regulator with GAF, ATPase, and Fis domain